MDHSPFNPGIDDADLLAVVEGTPLPPERAAVVREALSRDHRLAELIALMRADREAMSFAGTVAAPADLLDRVESVLEREALVGLAHTEAAAAVDHLPVSVVVPARRALMSSRMVAGLSAAAAVALVAGGIILLSAGGTNRPNANLASSDGTRGGGSTEPGTIDLAASADRGAISGAADIANLAGASGPIDVAVGDERSTFEQSPIVVAGTETPLAAPTPGPSLAELLDAAQQGRLALELRTASDQAAVARVRAAMANSRLVHLQRVEPSAATLLTGAVASAWQPRVFDPVFDPALPGKPLPANPLASANGGGHAQPGTGAAPAGHGSSPASGGGPVEQAPVYSGQVFVAAVPSTADGLQQLMRALTSDAVPAAWRVLPRPMAVDAPSDTGSILWWTAPASTWSGRVNVPVVVRSN